VNSSEFPTEVRRFLWDEGVARRHPAYIICDSHNRVIRTGGELDFFGVPELFAGKQLSEQAPVFLGLEIAGGNDPQHFPFIEMVSNLVADVFAVGVDDEIWYLLLDTTREAEVQRRRQDKSHRRELKRRLGDVVPDWITVPDPIAALAAFDSLVLERDFDGRLMRVGDAPGWLTRLWPESFGNGDYFNTSVSPFLEHFIEDAEETWWAGEGVTLPSGAFTEIDGMGGEWQLEAMAVQSRGRSLLIVQDVGNAQKEKTDFLQLARNKALEHGRMLKEVELKDVLLHCIVHDLSSPLAATMATLEFLKDEDLSENARELITMTFSQLERQDLLIRMILDVFSADSSQAIGFEDVVTGTEIVDCIGEVRKTIEPLAAARSISFNVDTDSLEVGSTVRGESLRLSRILTNLVDNARRHTGRGKTIGVHARNDGSKVFFAVEDDGPGVGPEMVTKLFDRFAQAGAGKGAAGLGLHFCRITVEAWGGEIGYDRSEEGRSRFWFTLPLVSE
jgi:signal transduction histidine kinase